MIGLALALAMTPPAARDCTPAEIADLLADAAGWPFSPTAAKAAGGDVHVLVVTVEDLEIRLNYSDLHRGRFRFFQRLLEEVGFVWAVQTSAAGAGLNAGRPYMVGEAVFRGQDRAALEEALEDAKAYGGPVIVHALTEEIAGHRHPRGDLLFDPELVVRASTAPARPGAAKRP